jgi:hypothetical protein
MVLPPNVCVFLLDKESRAALVKAKQGLSNE